MYLEIVTPDKKIFGGEIKLILVPGSQGPFEVLRNHAPIISTLTAGKMKVVLPEGEKNFYDIKSGVIEVLNNKVVVLAEM